MVQGHQQLVLFVVQAQQGDPQQRAVLQVELGAGFVLADLPGPGFALGRRQVAEIDQLQVEFSARGHLLQGLAVAFEKARAQ